MPVNFKFKFFNEAGGPDKVHLKMPATFETDKYKYWIWCSKVQPGPARYLIIAFHDISCFEFQLPKGWRLSWGKEAGTFRRLTELREIVLKPLISEHHGRIVKFMGDGLLVEFTDSVYSIACAPAPETIVAIDPSPTMY